VTPAERGAAWGRLEAALQLEAVADGYRLRVAEWTTGQWSGYVPPGEGAVEYEETLDRAAEAAYNAAIAEAGAVS